MKAWPPTASVILGAQAVGSLQLEARRGTYIYETSGFIVVAVIPDRSYSGGPWVAHGRHRWPLVGEVDFGVVAAVLGGYFVIGNDQLKLPAASLRLDDHSPVQRFNPPRRVPCSRAPSRQRTANRQPKGPTAVSSDQASDLHFLVAGAGFEPAASGL
jgi:hypothetical protein